MSGLAEHSCREKFLQKPLLEDTAGSVELHIVGVTILSFSTQALYGLSFSLWHFHLIMNIIFYIVKIKGNLASHVLLQVIKNNQRSRLVIADFRQTCLRLNTVRDISDKEKKYYY